MSPLEQLVLCFTVVASAATARADLNNWSCVPNAAHPYPVVLVPGQAGHYQDLTTIANRVVADGHTCVFGLDYGLDAAGITGRAHLSHSGGELAAFVGKVLTATGKPQVDLITFSEGGMVADNFILAKGGASKVHRVAGFAPGHHPYAHVGAPTLVDNDLFLPNMMKDADEVVPVITEPEVANTAFTVYKIFNGPANAIDWDLVTSDFVADLFDPNYWTALHAGLSEPDWVFIRLKTAGRSLPTKDAAPNVCYANFVSLIGDLLVGSSAGFQDPASNINNVAVPTYADHVGLISDPQALAGVVASLDAPCTAQPSGPAVSGFSLNVPSGVLASPADSSMGGAANSGGLFSERAPAGGCSTAPGHAATGETALLLLALLLVSRRSRAGFAARRW